MKVNEPLIHSMLDDDWYKTTMGSVVLHNFPNAEVEYQFINRGKTPFPKGFDKELNYQIGLLAVLGLTRKEEAWLKTIPYMRPTYAEWLMGFRMNPGEVQFTQVGTDLRLSIRGPWYKAIYWEVKLMAIISELYFRLTNQDKENEWENRIRKKAFSLSDKECFWIDFGTRRRYSYEVQNKVVEIMKTYKGFLGTSNPHLAMKHGVVAHGTYAHEVIMAMSALYGVRMANKMWMKHWSDYFGGALGVALTDTFTTEKFLPDFGSYEARLFDGLRQDSGDPMEWGRRVLAHYKSLNIPTENKRLVFSDGLDDTRFRDISWTFRGRCQPIGGIGTFLTNDVGPKALNMVIKMTKANFGQGWVDVVKLSDSPGKHTGQRDAVDLVKRELGIV
jgi:nicotinate phosphoribosyltransferase